jgi:hypothetical protein
MTKPSTRRLMGLALAALAAAFCLAACGSSSGTNTRTSSAAASASTSADSGGSTSGFSRTALATCLKKHGVTLPARPGGHPPRHAGSGSGGGPGFFFGGGGGGAGPRRFSNPKFRAALAACGGGRFAGPGRRFTLNHTAVTKFEACVKQHGYDLPQPNFSGRGPVFPRSIESNAKFEKAARACAADLRPSAPGAGAPAGAGSSSSSGT